MTPRTKQAAISPHTSTSSVSSMSSTLPEKPIIIGVITQPHGIRGELKVHLFNPESEVFSHTEKVWVRAKGQTTSTKYEISAVRYLNKTPLLQLVGCADRNQAEQLRGAELAVTAEELPELADDEFYMHELEGLPVYHVRTGESMGVVREVLPSPGHPLLVILYQEREVLVPLVEEWVPLIDLETQRVEIAPIPGLFDDHHL